MISLIRYHHFPISIHDEVGNAAKLIKTSRDGIDRVAVECLRITNTYPNIDRVMSRQMV
jgi:hypothetical protein